MTASVTLESPNALEHLMVSIVIPAFREEEVIASVVAEIVALALPSSEVIVVDDGSGDGTSDRARGAGARVITHPYNIGNGAAIKTGIRAARGRIIVLMDGDGQHQPADIIPLIRKIADFHMVIGARDYTVVNSKIRVFGNNLFNGFASLVAEFPIQDLTSGFRVIRAKDAQRFCDMLPNRFSSATTSTLIFLRSGRTITYSPINILERVGQSKIRVFRDGVEFFLIIIKIATLFSPLRVFIPASSFFLSLGALRYLYTYLLDSRFTNMSHLLISTGVIVFLLGLISEQIATLRLENSATVLDFNGTVDYEIFRNYPDQS